jgi:hypothetical protein
MRVLVVDMFTLAADKPQATVTGGNPFNHFVATLAAIFHRPSIAMGLLQ